MDGTLKPHGHVFDEQIIELVSILVVVDGTLKPQLLLGKQLLNPEVSILVVVDGTLKLGSADPSFNTDLMFQSLLLWMER